mgnify:CR=1 FL=1
MSNHSLDNKKLATRLIHAGAEPDPSTGAIMTPIYQTSTYVQTSPGQHKGYEYARSQNPTRAALESALAVIENGKYGLAFSSGVAATDAGPAAAGDAGRTLQRRGPRPGGAGMESLRRCALALAAKSHPVCSCRKP